MIHTQNKKNGVQQSKKAKKQKGQKKTYNLKETHIVTIKLVINTKIDSKKQLFLFAFFVCS